MVKKERDKYSEKLCAMVSPSLKINVEVYASDLGLTPSDIVRMSLIQYLRKSGVLTKKAS